MFAARSILVLSADIAAVAIAEFGASSDLAPELVLSTATIGARSLIASKSATPSSNAKRVKWLRLPPQPSVSATALQQEPPRGGLTLNATYPRYLLLEPDQSVNWVLSLGSDVMAVRGLHAAVRKMYTASTRPLHRRIGDQLPDWMWDLAAGNPTSARRGRDTALTLVVNDVFAERTISLHLCHQALDLSEVTADNECVPPIASQNDPAVVKGAQPGAEVHIMALTGTQDGASDPPRHFDTQAVNLTSAGEW